MVIYGLKRRNKAVFLLNVSSSTSPAALSVHSTAIKLLARPQALSQAQLAHNFTGAQTGCRSKKIVPWFPGHNCCNNLEATLRIREPPFLQFEKSSSVYVPHPTEILVLQQCSVREKSEELE
jgi:hypothetical protein